LPIKINAEVVANNIVSIANELDDLVTIPKKYPSVQAITLGPENGILIINKYCKLTKEAAKYKQDQ